MDFALTQTQRDLAEAARRYLAGTFPAERVTALAGGGGAETGTWQELVRQGWLDPDLGMVELGLLAQESGYALHPTPWWTTAALTGRDQPSTLVNGDFTRTGGRITGRALLVPDAGTAATLIVEVEGRFFAVAGQDATIRERASLDRLRRMHEVTLRDAPAVPVEPPSRARLTAMAAGEAVGVAARAMDFAVDHARTREQFGRPIGSFQAVAHQLAAGYVELELARSLAYRAAWLAGAGAPPAELEPALASALIAGREAAVRCCEIAVQTLGGMGVTWEHPLHLWYRRALWLQAFASGMPDPYETLAAELFDTIAVEA